MAFCPNCKSTFVDVSGQRLACRNCTFDGPIGSPYTDFEAKPPTPKPARIDLATVKADIGKAFDEAIESIECNERGTFANNERLAEPMKAARARVDAFLAQEAARDKQRDAERKQLHDALAACNVLVAALGTMGMPGLSEAGRLARIALAHPGP